MQPCLSTASLRFLSNLPAYPPGLPCHGFPRLDCTDLDRFVHALQHKSGDFSYPSAWRSSHAYFRNMCEREGLITGLTKRGTWSYTSSIHAHRSLGRKYLCPTARVPSGTQSLHYPRKSHDNQSRPAGRTKRQERHCPYTVQYQQYP